MKKLTYIIVTLIFVLSACSEKSDKTTFKKVSENKSTVVFESDFTYQEYELSEFEFKNHIYIYSKVRDGIAMTHAGHCPCNKK